MNVAELMEGIETAPLSQRADLQKMALYAAPGGSIAADLADHLANASTYRDFFNAIFTDDSQKNTLLWAECAKMNRRNWLSFFEPRLCVQNLRMKTDGLPIQMGSGVVLAPTGSRDNIANLYLFDNGGFNRQAAEFVTSVAGRFTIADHDFFGIYGLYKYRGNVILETWDEEQPPVHNPQR